jgi:4-hydroxybenzoate polyprenyltransferase
MPVIISLILVADSMVGFLINNPIAPYSPKCIIGDRGIPMAENVNTVKWLARIGVGLSVAGLVLLFLPWICVIAPFLAQFGVIFGLIGYLRSAKDGDPQMRLLSIAALIVGLVGLLAGAIMYTQDWMIW